PFAPQGIVEVLHILANLRAKGKIRNSLRIEGNKLQIVESIRPAVWVTQITIVFVGAQVLVGRRRLRASSILRHRRRDKAEQQHSSPGDASDSQPCHLQFAGAKSLLCELLP